MLNGTVLQFVGDSTSSRSARQLSAFLMGHPFEVPGLPSPSQLQVAHSSGRGVAAAPSSSSSSLQVFKCEHLEPRIVPRTNDLQQVKDRIGFSHVLHDPTLGCTFTIRFRWAPMVDDLQNKSATLHLLRTLNESRLEVRGSMRGRSDAIT
jgi:hypothetical protein